MSSNKPGVQPQPRAGGHVFAALGAEELGEQFFKVLWRHTDASVAYPVVNDLDISAILLILRLVNLRPHPDRPAVGRVLVGIADQIGHHLHHAGVVGEDGREVFWHLNHQLLFLLVNLTLQAAQCLINDTADGNRRHLQSQMAGLDPRRSEEHTSELQSPTNLVCRLLLEKKKKHKKQVRSKRRRSISKKGEGKAKKV